MATGTKIEWCEHTDNLWWGCVKVHAGCDHCYAETLSHRWDFDVWGLDKPRREIKSVWNDLKKQEAAAAAAGEMHRVFVGSMMDIFEKPMPLINSKGEPVVVDGQQMSTENARQHFFYHVIPDCPNLIFLLLTKRPSNINKYIPEEWKANPPDNVMFGTSPCDQKTAETLIPQLLKSPGKHFLSIEPLLGSVKLWNIPLFEHMSSSIIDWIIVGGESGHQARPMLPDWVRNIRDLCDAAAIPFFFKQWGQYGPVPAAENEASSDSFRGQQFKIVHLGKKAAGRFLDGKEYSEFPWQLFTGKNDNKVN